MFCKPFHKQLNVVWDCGVVKMQSYVSRLGRAVIIGAVALSMTAPALGQGYKIGTYRDGNDICKYNGNTIVCIDNDDANNANRGGFPENKGFLVTASRGGKLVEFLYDSEPSIPHVTGRYEIVSDTSAGTGVVAKGRIPVVRGGVIEKAMRDAHNDIVARVMKPENFVK